MYKEVFASRLKEARSWTGLTQQEVANLIGTRQNTIAKYENETLEPSIETLGKLADCYGVSVDWLIGRGIQTGFKPNYDNTSTKEIKKIVGTN